MKICYKMNRFAFHTIILNATNTVDEEVMKSLKQLQCTNDFMLLSDFIWCSCKIVSFNG